ncbi:MAG: hypothetical protein HKN82_05650 [Akkermansiaceae bacterium]|nr:hypothetical protein [Akkermansiaceae bacterium]NNM28873.1 hypothetical protein [Akkermansiaceae bacterium]
MTAPRGSSIRAALRLLPAVGIGLLWPGTPKAGELPPPAALGLQFGIDREVLREPGNGGFLESLGSDDFGVLYRNDDGPINEWSLTTRFDAQYGHLDSDRGNGEEFEVRRFRPGTSIEFLDNWRLKVTADLADADGDVNYDGLSSAFLRYRASDDLKFRLGKQVPHFSQEWSTPSMELPVIERSLLVQQIRPRRATGISIVADPGNWEAEAGAFSGDFSPEISNFDSGWFYVANLGYDFTDIFTWWKDLDLNLYYMHTDGHAGNDAVPPYAHSYSAAVKVRKKRFRLAAEYLLADGMMGRPDAWGVQFTPTWELIDGKLDLVFRYQYAETDGRDGLRLRRRYDFLAPRLFDRGRGEEFEAYYLGLRLHLIEDRLVYMAGGEWGDMDDNFRDGGALDRFTFLTALRFNF